MALRDLLWPEDKPLELSPQALKRRPAVIARKGKITARISESTRTIAFGALASCYALLIAEPDVVALFAPSRPAILASALMAFVALVLDALQYVFSYINVQKALGHPEQGFPRDWSRGCQQGCFLAKQLFAYLGALALIFAIAGVLA